MPEKYVCFLIVCCIFSLHFHNGHYIVQGILSSDRNRTNLPAKTNNVTGDLAFHRLKRALKIHPQYLKGFDQKAVIPYQSGFPDGTTLEKILHEDKSPDSFANKFRYVWKSCEEKYPGRDGCTWRKLVDYMKKYYTENRHVPFGIDTLTVGFMFMVCNSRKGVTNVFQLCPRICEINQPCKNKPYTEDGCQPVNNALYVSDYRCTCAAMHEWDERKLKCEQRRNACIANYHRDWPNGKQACGNHGTCVPTLGTNDYTCQCDKGFKDDLLREGPDCEARENPCLSNPCVNGKCRSKDFGGYRCICDPGYGGANCTEVEDICMIPALDPCHHLNTYQCKSKGSRVLCICKETSMGKRCSEPRDACLSNFNNHHPNGYDACGQHGTCHPQLGSSNYSCDCPKGYNDDPLSVWPDCDSRENPCLFHPCVNGQCSSSKDFSTYSCKCDPGYAGTNCSEVKDICLIKEMYPCHRENTTTCKSIGKRFHCSCNESSMGKTCSEPRDACISTFHHHHPNGHDACGKHGKCHPILGTNNYTCDCEKGYKDDHYRIWADCSAHENPCENSTCVHGQCRSSKDFDSYSCVCDPGYGGDNCSQVENACLIAGLYPCHQNNTKQCESKGRKYHCSCKESSIGKTCSQPRDACILNFDRHHPNGHNACGKHGTCHPHLGTNNYSCDCHKGYIDDPQSVWSDCDARNNPCLSQTCVHGKCRPSSDFSKYSCICDPGYGGTTCSKVINVCLIAELYPCHRENTFTCQIHENKFHCTCKESSMGETCSEPRDACFSSFHRHRPKGHDACGEHGMCHPQLGTSNYSCDCHKGFKDDPGNVWPDCDAVEDPCLNHTCVKGKCRLSDSSMPSCICDPGYGGINCSKVINICNITDLYPCDRFNTETCKAKGVKFHCMCKASSMGKLCREPRNACISSYYRNHPSGQHACGTHGSCKSQLGTSNYSCDCQKRFKDDPDSPWPDCNMQEKNTCVDTDCIHGYCSLSTGNKSGRCVCNRGYGGEDCSEVENICRIHELFPCDRHSTESCMGNGFRFRCACKKEAMGEICDKPRNACINNYHLHQLNGNHACGLHGKCIPKLGSNKFTCKCSPGYKDDPTVEGPDCKAKDNLCNDIDCHHGTCRVQKNTPFCECDENYGGHDCSEVVNSCLSEKLQPCDRDNTEICMSNSTSHHCECKESAMGETCEEARNACITNYYRYRPSGKQACGHGDCIPVLGTNHYHCNCDKGYTDDPKNDWSDCDLRTCKEECVHGLCQPKGKNLYECDCDEGYTGSNCSREEEKGNWGIWHTWGACHPACGRHRSQMRKRVCSINSCHGEENEEKSCPDKKCRIHGKPSDWGEWGPCLPMCASGEQERHRKCVYDMPTGIHVNMLGNGIKKTDDTELIPCKGASIESRPCSDGSCDLGDDMPGDNRQNISRNESTHTQKTSNNGSTVADKFPSEQSGGKKATMSDNTADSKDASTVADKFPSEQSGGEKATMSDNTADSKDAVKPIVKTTTHLQKDYDAHAKHKHHAKKKPRKDTERNVTDPFHAVAKGATNAGNNTFWDKNWGSGRHFLLFGVFAGVVLTCVIIFIVIICWRCCCCCCRQKEEPHYEQVPPNDESDPEARPQSVLSQHSLEARSQKASPPTLETSSQRSSQQSLETRGKRFSRWTRHNSNQR